MISIGLRIIREHNRAYKLWMRFLWRIYGKESPIVFMVHEFKRLEDIQNAFSLSYESFCRLLTFLSDNGWRALTYDELKNAINSKKKISKCYYVTFDDAYETVYTQAFPLLKQYGIHFTTFLTKDLIGKPGFLNTEQISEMCKSEIYHIGGHGNFHQMFRYYSKERMIAECKNEKEWLERQFKVPVDSFAFPYGRIVEVSNNNRKLIRKLNYSLAFSAIEGPINSIWYTGKFFIPRVNVSETFVNKFISGKKLKYKDCEGR